MQVLYDFTQRFHTVEEKALFKAWPSFSENIGNVLQQFDSKNTFATEWEGDVARCLMFLKVLPKQSGRRNVAPTVTFQKAVKKLIVFSQVLTMTKGALRSNRTKPFLFYLDHLEQYSGGS